MLDLLVAADDRTGALEVAAALADLGAGPVVMVPWASRHHIPTVGAVVVDLGSRHLDPAVAGERAAVIDGLAARRHVHKIDSALRGNWATELASRLGVRTRPAVVIAALPSAGRHVAGGEVRQWIDGRAVPIAEVMAGDPRAAPASSRPADLLRVAGLTEVEDAIPPDQLERRLLHSSTTVLVPDAASAEDLRLLASAVAGHPGALLAGTAAAVAASVAIRSPPQSSPVVASRRAGHVVLVVGSRHDTARRQAELVRRQHDPPRVSVLLAPGAPPGPVTDEAAAAVAAELAAAADAARTPTSAVVVIGGDTAAAVLGDEPRRVLGTLGPGVAVSVLDRDPDGPIAVTRAGSFGDDDALVTLVQTLLARPEG